MPPPPASAIVRIERLAPELFAEAFGMGRIGEAIDQVPPVIAAERMMARRDAQVAAECIDDAAVRARAPIGRKRDLMRDTRDPCAPW